MTSGVHSSQPRQIKKAGARELKILWEDGHESIYPFSHLRRSCRCAVCVDEFTGRPLLDGRGVPETLEGTGVSVVGRYALSVSFGDGHATGIYSFEHLRRICPCGCGVDRAREGDSHVE